MANFEFRELHEISFRAMFSLGVAVERHAEGVLAGIGADERLEILQRLGLERVGVVVREVAVVRRLR